VIEFTEKLENFQAFCKATTPLGVVIWKGHPWPSTPEPATKSTRGIHDDFVV
jgi:hypothetical protein